MAAETLVAWKFGSFSASERFPRIAMAAETLVAWKRQGLRGSMSLSDYCDGRRNIGGLEKGERRPQLRWPPKHWWLGNLVAQEEGLRVGQIAMAAETSGAWKQQWQAERAAASRKIAMAAETLVAWKCWQRSQKRRSQQDCDGRRNIGGLERLAVDRG